MKNCGQFYREKLGAQTRYSEICSDMKNDYEEEVRDYEKQKFEQGFIHVERTTFKKWL